MYYKFMSKIAFNSLFKDQNKKLIRASFKKAFISSVNVSSNTADVYFAENPSTTIRNVPLASHIDSSSLVKGDRCRVDVFDETNPNDMVVAYIYGRSIKSGTLFKTGTQFYAGGTTFPKNIAHGLVDKNGNGVVPDFFGVLIDSFVYYGPTNRTFLWWADAADATNIEVQSDGSPSTISATVYWFAIKFS